MALLVIGCAIANIPSLFEQDDRFVTYDNGTVLDKKTNLMWAAKDNGKYISWQEAKNYCENYRGGGYTDWRIPTQDELAGLYDASKGYWPSCFSLGGSQVHLTRLIRLTCSAVYASETRNSEYAYVSFNTDNVTGSALRGWVSSKRAFIPVLPVRSVK